MLLQGSPALISFCPICWISIQYTGQAAPASLIPQRSRRPGTASTDSDSRRWYRTEDTVEHEQARREFLRLGTTGLAVAGLVGATAATIAPERAAAQAPSGSTLRTVLDRGKLVVGTGSTNAPWHFENEKGELVGMDIAMARILAQGLFEDASKVEFVRQDPAQRIPNINT